MSGTELHRDRCDKCAGTGGAHTQTCPTQPYMKELLARRAAMDAAYITIKYVGDSTVKKLWRACGYDIPKRGR